MPGSPAGPGPAAVVSPGPVCYKTLQRRSDTALSGNVYDELKARGFVAQVSDEQALRRMLGEKTVTFYVGFDSTAASLHAGSLVPIMAMMHLRRAGHRALALVGGGTTMVGDPSGRTEMRRMLDESLIRAYG